jgi:hypothetical protein
MQLKKEICKPRPLKTKEQRRNMKKIILFDIEDTKSNFCKNEMKNADVVGAVDEYNVVTLLKSRNAENGTKMSLKKFGKRAVTGKI